MNGKGLISGAASVFSAGLLAVWYLLAVSGVDVHRDMEHGRTYVVCCLSGYDCERIHPECQCHDHDGPEGECMDGEDCCSDDFWTVLSLTDGTAPAQPDLPAPVVSLQAVLPFEADRTSSASIRVSRTHSPPPDPATSFIKLLVLRV